MVDNGTPEYRIFAMIPDEGLPFADFRKTHADLAKFGLKNGMKNKWFKIDK